MIVWTPLQLKALWTRQFRKSGRQGSYAGLVDELAPEIQARLQSLVPPAGDEIAVVGSYRDADNWFVLTTSRLVAVASAQRYDADITAIRAVRVDLQDRARRRVLLRGADELELTMRNGDRFFLRCEPGAPLLGVWNVVLNSVARHSPRPRAVVHSAP